MSDIDELRSFVALVDAGTATRAAARRGVAVSAISRRLKDLEARLGAQLLNRTTRKMSLTEEGRVFYERASRILADLAEAEAEIAERSAVLKGRLKIAAPVSFGAAHLASAVSAFMHAHPAVKIELDMSDARVDLVDEGVDLAVRIGSLTDSALMARKIVDVRHAVCAAPGFFNARGAPRTPRDLEGAPGLCYGNLRDPSLWPFRGPDGSQGAVRVATRFEATNGDALREVAIAGHGVLCEPTFILHGAVERGLLQPVLTEYDWYDMALFVVYPPTRHLSSRARRFIDFLADRFGPDPYWDGFLRRARDRDAGDRRSP